MKTSRRAAAAVGCAGALALTASAFGAKGDTVETGVYHGSKLDLKVAKGFLQPIVHGRVSGRCVEPNFPPGTYKTDTTRFPSLKYRGKRPRVGFKSFRTSHVEGRDDRGRRFARDHTVTLKFSTAKKAKVTARYKHTLGKEVCRGKVTGKINGIIRPK